MLGPIWCSTKSVFLCAVVKLQCCHMLERRSSQHPPPFVQNSFEQMLRLFYQVLSFSDHRAPLGRILEPCLLALAQLDMCSPGACFHNFGRNRFCSRVLCSSENYSCLQSYTCLLLIHQVRVSVLGVHGIGFHELTVVFSKGQGAGARPFFTQGSKLVF